MMHPQRHPIFGSRRALGRAALIFAVAGLGVSGASLAAWSLAGRAGASSVITNDREWGVVARQSFDITTIGTGQLEAKAQKEFRNTFDSECSILEIIKEGVQVKEGDVLVRLNAEQPQKQLDQEMLQLEIARAEMIRAEQEHEIQINENESGIRKGHLAVDLAELDLRKWMEGEVRSQRQALAQAVAESTSEVARLQAKVNDDIKLLEKGYVARDETQRNEIELRKAQTALEKARLDSEVFEHFELPKEQRNKASALEEAQAEMQRTQSKNVSQLASKRADRDNRRQQLALRAASVQKLRSTIGNAVMAAPGPGLVVYGTSLLPPWRVSGSGPMAVGRKLYPNELILALPDTSAMLASVRVSESLAGKVAAGQHATIKLDALPGAVLTGKVESVGILAERAGWDDPNVREYSVKVRLDTPIDPRVKPSMGCEAELTLDHAQDVAAVPLQSVFSEGPVRFVIVERAGRLVRSPVKVDKRSDRLAAIALGVTEGERVLLRVPTAGEIAVQPWTDAELASVGLRRAGEAIIAADSDKPLSATASGAAQQPGGSVRENAAGEKKL
ncbi:HlyD family efflux transporter periplasmic adaptor subunit [soil metagenome]